MHELARPALDGEILSPRDGVRVVARLHALREARTDRTVPAGLTVQEIAEEIYPQRVPPLWVHLTDDRGSMPLPREVWARVRPKPGTTVTMRPALHGDDAWRIVAQVALVVAAIAIAVFAPPLIGPFAAALLGAGVAFAGNLAISALFPVAPPPPGPIQEQFRSLPSIANARNQMRPYDPVPFVLGRHRVFPYHAAKGHTEIVGNAVYARMLLTPGYGPQGLDINDMKIGETLITTFGVEYEIRQGFPADTGVSIYHTDVDQQDLAIELHNDSGGGDFWEVRTTSPNTDIAIVDVTAPKGMFRVDEDGNNVQHIVIVETQFSPVGEGSWTIGGNLTFYKSMETARQSLHIPFPARGQYDVRVRRLTGEAPESTRERTYEQVIWTALRSRANTPPITFPKPLALIGLLIRASGELSGEIETISCIARALVKAWNGGAWVDDQESSNPADLYRHVLQGPFNARPVSDAEIDLTNLQAWWSYCLDKGFTYNSVISTRRSIWSVLAEIAAAGRAAPTFIDGRWGVIWDRPDDPIVQHFHPRNSWGFSASRVYARLPHGLRCRFINADNEWTDDERIVYDDGYDAGNATLFEAFEFPGVTDPELIWRHARFHIAQARLRPERIVLNVDWEHLVCQRGDRVRVAHDAALIGLGSGRVKSVDGQEVTLDEILALAEGVSYGIRLRLADGTFVYRTVATEGPVETSVLELVGAVDDETFPGSGFTFGEAEQDSAVYRVYAIEHQQDLVARLTLVDDAPEISLADQGEIPDYDAHVTPPVDPLSFPPTDFWATEAIEGYGPSVRAVVRLSWRPVRAGHIRAYEVQQREDDTSTDWRTIATVAPPANSVDVPLPVPGVRSYRVRSLFNSGSVSTWTTLAGLNFLGLSFAPDDIANLHERLLDGQTRLAWDPVVEQRTVRYEVRKGSTWDTGLLVGDEITTADGWPATGDGTYHLRAYVLTPYAARVYSVGTASIQIGDSIKARNIILSVDEQDGGWTGSLDGGVIDGSFIRTDVGETIGEAFAEEVIDDLDAEGAHIAVYVSASIVDVGRAAECRFWTEYEGVGVLQGEDFLGQTDVLGSVDLLGVAPTRFMRATPIWRFATIGETDVFAPDDIFEPSDIFTGDITWGDWVAVTQGARKARYFQPGLVLISDEATVDATGTGFQWFVDVPDRIDKYTKLTIPSAGYALSFYEGGYTEEPPAEGEPTPFKGGPRSAPGEGDPHAQWSVVPPTQGDDIEITDLTLAGCTVHCLNGGSPVTRAGVNLLFHAY